jgi:hypothetical protein
MQTPSLHHPLAAEERVNTSFEKPSIEHEEDANVDNMDVGSEHNSLSPEKVIEMPAWKRFLFSKWGCAVLLTLLTIIILLFIRPAFFLRKRENLLERPRINWLIVFITTLVLFAAYAGIPALVTYCRKQWVGQVSS